MLLIALLTFSFAKQALAHEIQSITQHVNLKSQHSSGWQQDIHARIEVNRKLDVGAQVTYLERFNLYEKRAGAFVVLRPSEKLVLEARYLQGKGNELLPEKQSILSAYYAWKEGITPFVYYRDSLYSVTHVNNATVGVEIEKVPHVIFVPMGSAGRATFHSPAQTQSLYSYGMRAIYYVENHWSFALFGFRGREASQGIIGRSTVVIDTLSGGATIAKYIGNLKTEIGIDHTDFDQINNQFFTTTLNLTWMF